jgi:hypothetical protein
MGVPTKLPNLVLHRIATQPGAVGLLDSDPAQPGWVPSLCACNLLLALCDVLHTWLYCPVRCVPVKCLFVPPALLHCVLLLGCAVQRLALTGRPPSLAAGRAPHCSIRWSCSKCRCGQAAR